MRKLIILFLALLATPVMVNADTFTICASGCDDTDGSGLTLENGDVLCLEEDIATLDLSTSASGLTSLSMDVSESCPGVPGTITGPATTLLMQMGGTSRLWDRGRLDNVNAITLTKFMLGDNPSVTTPDGALVDYDGNFVVDYDGNYIVGY